jgi:hypothetical protein
MLHPTIPLLEGELAGRYVRNVPQIIPRGTNLDILLYAHLTVETGLACTLRNPLLESLQLIILPHLISKGNIFALGIEPEIAACTFSWRAVKPCVLSSGSIRIRGFWRGYRGWGWGWRGNVACVRLVWGEARQPTWHSYRQKLRTLIEANLGCIGLYLSFLD